MNSHPNNIPTASILMPVRDERDYITRSLGAVLAQDYPPERMEVIIADGGSTDGTRQQIDQMVGDGTPFPVEVIDNPGRIVPTGLNLALRRAAGEVLIRIDGHCQVAPDYVSRCVHHLAMARHLTEASAGNSGIPIVAVGGPIETVGETYSARVIAAAMSSAFGVGGSAFRTIKDRSMLVDTVAFPAYTRGIVELVGLYDEELVRDQDDEYNYRIRAHGGSILLADDVRSKYYSRSSLRSLWRQYYQYGYWKVRVLQKHPRQMKVRQFVPGIFVTALLLSALLGFFAPAGRILLVAVVASYLLADLLASLVTASQRGWRLLPLLPLVYPILHLSYGLGFLWGLIRFANRWDDRRGKVPDWSPVERSAVSDR